nr:MAG TPA: hypothetical protein [Microviridae sp.]
MNNFYYSNALIYHKCKNSSESGRILYIMLN